MENPADYAPNGSLSSVRPMIETITQRLLRLDPTLQLHNEGDWQNPFDPAKPGYASFNDAGIEVETGEFLYAMVRLIKPERVLETGTHWGIGMSYLGQALKENKKGKLDTIEFLHEIYCRALERRNAMGLEGIVEIWNMDAAQFPHPGSTFQTYKLILLDTEPQTRFAELIKFFPYLEDGGFVFIHDLHQHMHQVPNEEHGFAWPYGGLPQQIKDWVKDGELRPFHFETPRGLTGFYKVSPQDYKWK